jgi:hypothetical protein
MNYMRIRSPVFFFFTQLLLNLPTIPSKLARPTNPFSITDKLVGRASLLGIVGRFRRSWVKKKKTGEVWTFLIHMPATFKWMHGV